MSYVSRFLKGKWLAKAGKYAFNPRKMTELLVQLGKYVSKNGLASVKDTLILMKDYLYDVTTGRYKGYEVKKFADRVTILEDAPFVEYSSTEVRGKAERSEDISAMVSPAVADYIVKNQLWTPAGRIVRLTSMIEGGDEREILYIERGKCYFQHNEWGKAINDFNKAKAINPDNEEAKQLHDMVYEILSFRYKDIYNP